MSHVAAHRWAELARGRVGEREARRMGAHADGCASCAKARDRVGGAVAAFGDIARTPAPELGWDTIRTRVYWATSSERREKERTQRMHAIRLRRWGWLAVPALAAAAAGLYVVRPWAGTPAAQPAPIAHAHVTPPAPRAPIKLAELTGVVTLVSGDVSIDGATSAARVMAQPLVAGSTVTTRDGRVAVQFGDGSVFAVGPRSTLSLRRFDAGAIELALGGAGDVTIEVAPRAPGQRFTVTAGDRTVEVRGTAFHVVRRGRAVDVACGHGLVAVHDRSGDLLVPAGQGVVVDDGEALADRAARPLDPSALDALERAIGPRLPVWPESIGAGSGAVVDTATLFRTSAPLAVAAPHDRAVRVDGVTVGAGAFVVRVMSGRHLVEAEQAPGHFEAGEWVEAGPGRADGRIDARIDLTTRPLDAAPPTSTAAARAARKHDLDAGLDHARVDACVRALAKQGLVGGTHVALELRVDAGGAINMLNVGDTDLPDSIASCVRDAVAAVRFPHGPAATLTYRVDF